MEKRERKMDHKLNIPAVVIKSADAYYLYPKKRGKAQCLVQINETGLFFWQMFKEFEDASDVVNEVCKKYNMNSEEQKKQVEQDVINYIKFFEKLELYNNCESKVLEKSVGQNISERSFSEQFSKMQKYYTESKKPFKFFIEITYNCNLKCKHCYRSEDIQEGHTNPVYLKKDRVLTLLDEMENMGAVEVIFTGGEPFLHPDIYEILDYASKKNLVVTVLSNGNFLANPLNVKKLERLNLFDIRVSIYGDKDRHDKMTKIKGSHDRSVQALKNIKEILGIGTAAFVVTKENYDDLESVINKFKELDINIALNSSITPTAKGSLDPCTLRISPDQYFEMVEKYDLPLTGTTCTAGISRFRINPDGEVNPCELIPGYCFGNIYKNSLSEIMDSSIRKGFIDMMEVEFEEHVCNTCSSRTECNFCPALFFQENNSFKVPSEYLCKTTEKKHKILEKRGIL